MDLSYLYEWIQIKLDPLQIRMVYCSYMYDQNGRVIQALFGLISGKSATKRVAAGVDPRELRLLNI